jgi:hypothetical protein
MNGRRRTGYRNSGMRRAPTGTINVAGLAALAQAAKVHEDEMVKDLLRAVALSGDPELARDAADYLGALAMEQVLEPDPFAPPVSPEEARGELDVGEIRNSGCRFGLYLHELCQHLLLVGRSGSGKTTAITRILKQLLSLGRELPSCPRILVFDRKRDYVHLPRLFPEIWMFRLPGEGFRWNALEPPGSWQRWADIFATTLANSCGFYAGMSTEGKAYEYLLDLYRRYDTASGVYPCMFDFRDYLEWLEAKNRVDRYSEEKNWHARIRNRVESLCNALRETADCSRGYPLAELLKHHVIFDMSELKPDAGSFFTETFLTQVVVRRMAQVERGGTLRSLAVFDEAKRLMPKWKEQSQNAISNVSDLVALSREFGVGLVAGECDPALLGDSIKSSCYTRLCFNQTHGRDVKDSASSLGLDAEQAAEIQKLGVGEAIVRLAGRVKRPFVLEVSP